MLCLKLLPQSSKAFNAPASTKVYENRQLCSVSGNYFIKYDGLWPYLFLNAV